MRPLSILHPSRFLVLLITLLTNGTDRDALVKIYFDHVHPFSPVINRTDFIHGYQSGKCSLLLLSIVLTTASIYASEDLLSTCGFSSRSAAQESFFSKTKLLYDFAAEQDPLLMLQGSIILCTVILDHPTDWDFDYWFHNAIRLATKLDVRNMYVFPENVMSVTTSSNLSAYGLFDRCVREEKPRRVLKLYRRIWWALYVRTSPPHYAFVFLPDANHCYEVPRHFLCLRQRQTLATH